MEMYEDLSKKLEKIMSMKYKISHYRKDIDHDLLKQIYKNKKIIEAIIDLSGFKPRNKYACMAVVYDVIFNGRQNGVNMDFVNRLIVPKKYLRINTLADGCKHIEKMCINRKEDTTISDSNVCNETKKQLDVQDLDATQSHYSECNFVISKEQQLLITNYKLKKTKLPFVYEIPILHTLKLSPKRHYILQSLPTTLPPYILNPALHSIVIDSCASPGNKTSHLAAIMNNTGKIIAVEQDHSRCETLKKNLILCNVRNVEILNHDFLKLDLCGDYVLVDPSCSGSGIHNEYSKQTERIRHLVSFQKKILMHSFKVKKAKKIIYSTCSVHEEENEMVVDYVIEKKEVSDHWRLEKINCDYGSEGIHGYTCSKYVLRFNRGENIGFFIALFVRRS